MRALISRPRGYVGSETKNISQMCASLKTIAFNCMRASKTCGSLGMSTLSASLVMYKTLSPVYSQDYFDRKRLVSKVKHARPSSPGGGKSKKYISQDLLFLQAVSNAHTNARQGRSCCGITAY